MATQYVNCPACNAPNDSRNTVCMTCGNMLPYVSAPIQQVYSQKPAGADKKILAGILGILLGGFGVHKFILGYKNEGIIMVATYVIGILLCGVPSLVIAIIGIIEGIIYLTKSDEEFVQTYILNKKPWF
jgi:TM2 domain-containing membrane protein YozV